jgi:hypothetical protein
MRLYYIIGLFILVGCSTYQKRPLTFLSEKNISFNSVEDTVTARYRLVKYATSYDKDTTTNSNDTFLIAQNYKSINFSNNNWYRKRFDSYYIPNGKTYFDFITLTYYKGKLVTIFVYSKESGNKDSLIKLTENFFHKKFSRGISKSSLIELDSLKYGDSYKGFEGKWTTEHGNFQKQKISVSYHKDLVYKETYLTITNKRVKLPSFCGTRTPWWYYLQFWRW